jgi:hypothetical protein
MENVERMRKYCVLCERVWGPGMPDCCTPTSLVAVSEAGPDEKPLYYDLEGNPLTDEDLSEIRIREREVQQSPGIVRKPSFTELAERILSRAEETEEDSEDETGFSYVDQLEFEEDVRRLRNRVGVYLLLLIATWVSAIGYFQAEMTSFRTPLALSFIGTLVLYLVASRRAYRVQKKIDAFRLLKPAAQNVAVWACVSVAALIPTVYAAQWGLLLAALGLFNPYLFGIYVPVSVLRRALRIKRRLAGEEPATPDHSRWKKNAENLRPVFFLGVAAWCAWLFALIGYGVTESPGFVDIFRLGLLGLYIAWFPVILLGYRVQRDLHELGLYKHGAWHVVVAGLLFSPIVGLYVGFSVLRLASRVKKRLDAETPSEGDSRSEEGIPEDTSAQDDLASF